LKQVKEKIKSKSTHHDVNESNDRKEKSTKSKNDVDHKSYVVESRAGTRGATARALAAAAEKSTNGKHAIGKCHAMPLAVTALWSISKTTDTIAPTVVVGGDECLPLSLVLRSTKASCIA